MRIGRFLAETEVEGPGLRAALWVQGCSIHCPGCCNPELLDAAGGLEVAPADLAARIAGHPVAGLTILGGEPLDQAAEIADLVAKLRQRLDIGIILFSGYPWPDIMADPARRAAVANVDLVIAGPFRSDRHPDARRWIGSSNQTVHALTPRYAALARCWPPACREIEIHLTSDDEIVINGTPFPDEPRMPLVHRRDRP